MPELPEVETVRLGLEKHLLGRKITSVVLRRSDLRFPFPRDFATSLSDRFVLSVEVIVVVVVVVNNPGMQSGNQDKIFTLTHSPPPSPP